MSICDSGIGCKLFGSEITIKVEDDHPLVLLGNQLPWEEMLSLIEDDLSNSTRLKKSHFGRKLKARIHLGAYLLQKMYNLKDREIERDIKYNAAYKVFCGYKVVDNWHAPDHTKIEAFRSRLSPITQQKLTNLICKNAVDIGLAEASDIDIDSTVQEANITYPTDAKMLRKLGTIAARVASAVKTLLPTDVINFDLDLKSIASKARACFFMKKSASTEDKAGCLHELLSVVAKPICNIVTTCAMFKSKLNALKWNIKRSINQLINHALPYFESVYHYIDTGSAQVTKRLSFHADNVSCFNKKKAHKKYEFGRAFQLGRLSKGNFLFVLKSHDVRMDDKKSFSSIIKEHNHVFGKNKLESVTTDKGYYSNTNVKLLVKEKVTQIGIQVPGNTKNKNIKLSIEEQVQLSNRRSGVEALIGHAKHGGQLGRSRMKNDRNTESAGYASILGFNLRQTIMGIVSKIKSVGPPPCENIGAIF